MGTGKRTSGGDESGELIALLEKRFLDNRGRHAGVEWSEVRKRLEARPETLWSVGEMERTGGEPDVVVLEPGTGRLSFVDCSTESPKGRRSLCYDREALESRKEHRPEGCAVEAAAAMGAELLSEDEYRALQAFGEYDQKTSSWVLTPPEMREQGGALFCDRRYGRVFAYHNGAESYYAVRAFRVRVGL